MSTGNDNKSSPQNQGVKSPPIDAQTISHPFHTYTSFPTHFTPIQHLIQRPYPIPTNFWFHTLRNAFACATMLLTKEKHRSQGRRLAFIPYLNP